MKMTQLKKYLAPMLFFPTLALAGQSLNIAIIQEWSTFNPVTSQLASNEALLPLILRRMVMRKADGSVLPDVAEAVPKLSKNKTALWKIRQNAKWADGSSITCADWHLGWQAGSNPNVSVESRELYDKISNIEWTDKNPQHCRVTYRQANWSYDRDLPPLLPSKSEAALLAKHKNQSEGYDRNSAYITAPTNKALYNGPYYVSEFKLGQSIILTRNEHFYGSRPQIERIIIKHIADTSSLKAHLHSGQINAISAVGFPPDTALLFDEEFQQNKTNLKVHFQNSSIFQGLYFNLQSEIFKDAHVREALSRAIDKDKIVKAFFNGKLEPAESILPPQHPAYGKKPPIYSVSLANQLLDKAGWVKSAKTGWREKNGQPLSFIFKTSAGLKVLENIQVYICEQFKSIGAQCLIKNEPPRVLLGQSVPRGEFDLAMYGQPIPPDSSLSSYFSSSSIPTAQNSWAGGNSIRVNSKQLDQLLKQFDSEPNRNKRNSLIKKIEAHLKNSFTMIPLYHRREAIVMPRNLQGLEPSYEGTGFTNPENWKLQ